MVYRRYPSKKTHVALLAGVGNNGGDALVVARLLYQADYPVKVFVVEYSPTYSNDCQHNLYLARSKNIPLETISSTSDLPAFDEYDIVVDGLFGTGLNRELSGLASGVIQRVNESSKK